MDAYKGSAVLFIGIVETPPCMHAEWPIQLLFIVHAHIAQADGQSGCDSDGLVAGESVCSELGGFKETGLFVSVRCSPRGFGLAKDRCAGYLHQDLLKAASVLQRGGAPWLMQVARAN